MISFPQETSSKNGASGSGEYYVSLDASESTAATNEQVFSLPRSGIRDPLRSVIDISKQIQDSSVAEQVTGLVAAINRILCHVQQRCGDLIEIPQLRAHFEEDGSVSLEWIFPDFRIGFNIESNPDDSGWHLISNKKLGAIAMSQPLPKDFKNKSETIARLIEFILANT